MFQSVRQLPAMGAAVSRVLRPLQWVIAGSAIALACAIVCGHAHARVSGPNMRGDFGLKGGSAPQFLALTAMKPPPPPAASANSQGVDR
ncbi:MAG TPA: hypothetical protein VK864_20250 [Longimicrobiales bacterium]|nr:hypothetical protein [Longimicrobiales bacterium]